MVSYKVILEHNDDEPGYYTGVKKQLPYQEDGNNP